ncbi:MAG: queuosine 5'-phosphate N-glycosylase/hydrolase [Desulfatibacillaceae bacterium]
MTCARVAESARDVRVDAGALSRFAGLLAESGAVPTDWDTTNHYVGRAPDTTMYFLALDAVNFCFFAPLDRSRWEVDVDGRRLSGYVGMAAALKRAVLDGRFELDARFFAEMTKARFAGILGGEGFLPLMAERAQSLRQTGGALMEYAGGDPLDFVGLARKSAVKFARLIAGTIPSFNDTAAYQGKTVYFHKRAQILASDLHGALDATGPGEFPDIGDLTCFADYKLPQVLRQAGVLEYSAALAHNVDNMIPLAAGGPEEVEIRAATVHAVELLRREMEGLGVARTSAAIDWMIWNMGQDDAWREKPYHRVVTIYY